ncbi:hypothetical protein [Agrobacterium tumefaciens]|uniref:hypothetical protein n=1 Tax=Agrobacterium tumefaciens TaxID=358 RepID=UPI003BA2117B
MSLAVRFLPDFSMFNACTGDGCSLQGWLSALSGWVGLIAAVVTIGFTRSQLAEQRKQTSFILGDGEPSIEPQSKAGNGSGPGFRVINWNRRSMLIDRIQIIDVPDSQKPIRLWRYATEKPEPVAGKIYCLSSDGSLDRTPKIMGWISRQEKPNVLDLEFRWTDLEKEPSRPTVCEGDVTIKIIAHYIDSKDCFELSSTMPACDFFP